MGCENVGVSILPSVGEMVGDMLEFLTVQNGREILVRPVRDLAGKHDAGFWRQNDVMRFKAHLF